jgi:hypothetical protein
VRLVQGCLQTVSTHALEADAACVSIEKSSDAPKLRVFRGSLMLSRAKGRGGWLALSVFFFRVTAAETEKQPRLEGFAITIRSTTDWGIPGFDRHRGEDASFVASTHLL